MSEQSNIGWTDSTWNPWKGCKKVSPGCAYCYAERDMSKYGQHFDAVTRTKDATFYAPLKWGPVVNPDGSTRARRIFTCSWSDFFIEEADEWRNDAWQIICETPQHVYLILTKRIERAASRLDGSLMSPLPSNVCLMTTVENQAQADIRIPELLDIPARWHGVSVEPLLGPVDLSPWTDSCSYYCDHYGDEYPLGHRPEASKLDWVIVGGESGGPEGRALIYRQTQARAYGADWLPRPDRVRWVRSLRDQCQQAGVPFFFKQFGGPRPGSGGRILDGREWNERPEFFDAKG